jgi:hypothetical protein
MLLTDEARSPQKRRRLVDRLLGKCLGHDVGKCTGLGSMVLKKFRAFHI